jgi:hypothetical protein
MSNLNAGFCFNTIEQTNLIALFCSAILPKHTNSMTISCHESVASSNVMSDIKFVGMLSKLFMCRLFDTKHMIQVHRLKVLTSGKGLGFRV